MSKDRVRRLMRENALLSPHRLRQGTPVVHDGSIKAEAPNLMWGTDVSASRPSRTAGFRNVEEVRAAVTEFKERYNRRRRLEKLGFMSPLEARQSYAIRKAA